MRLNRAAAGIATVAIASAAIVSGCGVTHHGAVPVTRPAQHQASARQVSAHRAHLTAAQRPAPADPSLAWLESAGGQAQVTVNDEIDTVAAALQAEDHAPTVANHLIFEADARVVRAQARTILRTPALLPAHNRAAYERMLNDFITVANLLQPGPGYGTTPQDYTAWYQALHASNITVS
jgi:ABC-type cobalamin transport system ATPase subunit